MGAYSTFATRPKMSQCCAYLFLECVILSSMESSINHGSNFTKSYSKYVTFPVEMLFSTMCKVDVVHIVKLSAFFVLL